MSPHVDFSVDLDALNALQAELNRLVVAVDELSTMPGAVDHEAMGGDDIADAVDRFVGRWRAGRHDVVQHLSACEEIVKLAISGYGGTDDGLRCAVDGTTTAARS